MYCYILLYIVIYCYILSAAFSELYELFPAHLHSTIPPNFFKHHLFLRVDKSSLKYIETDILVQYSIYLSVASNFERRKQRRLRLSIHWDNVSEKQVCVCPFVYICHYPPPHNKHLYFCHSFSTINLWIGLEEKN